jgi:putative nucleotidyltransferase with HDIG domain
VDAKPILARVGAYYHDIGKSLKPEYFVENQMGSKNKHDKLSPSMSTLIITAHVKEGMELGRQYKLPERIIDFIPQHHGTTLVTYFYEKALRKRSMKDTVREIDYRYPGPKPQSKETAIVMLADTVEAAVRAIPDPTGQKIEEMIDRVIKNRFMEGQLDECPLTLKDLSKIKESFLKILVGIHHQRIKYPEQEKKDEQPQEQVETKQEVSPQESEQKVFSAETDSADGKGEQDNVMPSESLERRIKKIDNM